MNPKFSKKLSDTLAEGSPQSMDEVKGDVHNVADAAKEHAGRLIDALLGAGLKPGLKDKNGKRYDGRDGERPHDDSTEE